MTRFARSLALSVMALTVTLCLTLTPGIARAADAVEALDQASTEADIVIVIPQLADASRKLAGWSQAVGIPSPEMQDALGSFKREIGIEAGLDDNGSMLIVIQNLAVALEQQTEPDFLLLMPVSDYAAFVGNFAGQGDGVTALTMPTGSPGFAKQVGGFAVMGKDQPLVEAYTPAHQGGQIVASLGATGATVLDGSDAAIYINVEKVGPQLNTMIDMAFAQMQANMMMGAMPNAEMFEQGMAMYAGAAHAILDGTTAMLISADITNDGLGFSKVLRLKEGSALSAYFPGGDSTAGQELASLPKQSYIFAGAIDGQAIDIGKLYEAIGENMDPAAMEAFAPAFDKAIALGKAARGAAFVFYAPDEMALMSGNILNTLTVVKTDDSAAYTNLLKDYIQAIDGFSIPIAGPGEPGGPVMTYTTNYTPGALQLQGTSVDQFQMQINMPPEMMQMMGPAAGIMGMFTNYRGFVAAKDDRVLITTSVDPQMVTAALDTGNAKNGLGTNDPIAQGRDVALPANSAMEMYLNLGGIAEMGNQFLTMFGAPAIQVPADLPPIAMGLAADGDTLHGRLYVPTAAIQFATNAAMQIYMQSMGGGPPPQGGPAPY